MLGLFRTTGYCDNDELFCAWFLDRHKDQSTESNY